MSLSPHGAIFKQLVHAESQRVACVCAAPFACQSWAAPPGKLPLAPCPRAHPSFPQLCWLFQAGCSLQLGGLPCSCLLPGARVLLLLALLPALLLLVEERPAVPALPHHCLDHTSASGLGACIVLASIRMIGQMVNRHRQMQTTMPGELQRNIVSSNANHEAS